MSEQNGFYIYSPKIEVYVLNSDGVVYDITPDISSASMTLNVNSPSTMNISLASRDEKYDGVFQPMDKVVAFARKEKRYQMFTGYLTDVPIYTIGSVSLKASCSLYKLQKLYWDEGLSESIHEYSYFLNNAGDDLQGSGGMGNLLNAIINVLINVGGWDKNKIHIAPLPTNITTYASELRTKFGPDPKSIEDYQALMGMGSTTDNVGTDVTEINGSQIKAAFTAGGRNGSLVNDLQWNAWANEINKRSKAHGERPAYPAWALAAMCEVESGWTADARGGDDWGLCQINKETWDGTGTASVVKPDGTTESYFSGENWKNGAYSIKVGGAILGLKFKQTMTKFTVTPNSLEHAVVAYAAYNAGNPDSYKTNMTAHANAEKYRKVAQRYIDACGGTADVTPSASVTSGTTTSSSIAAAKNSITQVAFNEVGTAENGANNVKYNTWYYGSPKIGDAWKWCAVFVVYCARHAGYGVDVINRTASTREMASFFKGDGRLSYLWSGNVTIEPGDIAFFCNSSGTINHVGIVNSVSGQKVSCIEGNSRNKVNIVSHTISNSQAAIKGSNHKNIWAIAKPNYGIKQGTAVKKNAPPIAGTTIDSDGVDLTTGLQFGNTSLDKAWWISQSISEPNDFSYLYRGARALINDTKVWDRVRTLILASMRDFASGPDGSIVMWFPDPFGMMTSDINYVIPNTEIIDVSISQSDEVYTHAYLAGGFGGELLGNDMIANIHSAVATIDNDMYLDSDSDTSRNNEVSDLLAKIMNMDGVENPEKLYSPNAIYRRFGARPLKLSPQSELQNDTAMPYFFALGELIKAWVGRYSVSIQTTFLPELRPGMRVYLSDEDIVCYVDSVSHSMSYSNGFTSSISLIAPMSSTRSGFISPRWATQ